jgi:hypothetical protein
MKSRGQKSKARSQNQTTRWFALLVLLRLGFRALADDFTSLCADRVALERVYYNHRLGAKPPFEQALPPATLENLVRQDLRKDAALKKAYGVEITGALLKAEVQRINTTTRAPEMLAEIKAALGNDSARFAKVFAKPILVERLLREKFDDDDALHAPQRRAVEQTRHELLAAHSSRGDEALTEPAATNDLVAKRLALLKRSDSNSMTETTWLLSARPAEKPAAESPDEIEIKKRFGPNAQIISRSSGAGREQKFYLEDLPGELQNVLRAQLRQSGDVSAVIETPAGFLLYVAKEKTSETLSVATLSVAKRDYEEWLNEQTPNAP